MEPSWFRYYNVMKKLSSFIGQWPYQRRRARLLGFTVATVATLSIIVSQVGKFMHCEGNRQCILETIPSLCLTTMIMVKLYTCQFNNNKIKYLTDCMLNDWKKLQSSEEFEIMKMYALNGRRLSLIYSSYCFVSCFIFILISLTPQILDIILPLNESRPILMPYEAYYFVDEREYFTYIFVHSLVAAEIGIAGLLAHDCMFVAYTEHVCSIFAIAGFQFENLVDDHMEVMNYKLDNLYYQKIALFVRTHRQALQYAELLEDAFTITLALQIILSTVWMSITLLQIVLLSDNTLDAARYVGIVGGELIHLFFFSLQGQKMIDHSLQIRDKIYNCLWYKIPVKSQKLLLHVMRRSLQPNFLSAGKIYIFSLKNFTAVMQTSLSYFTVLMSFQ